MELGKEFGRVSMPEQKSHILVNFLVRAIIGIAIIFFVNEFLASKGISAQVGRNPVTFLTSGVFGIPGVALLYGITIYQIL